MKQTTHNMFYVSAAVIIIILSVLLFRGRGERKNYPTSANVKMNSLCAASADVQCPSKEFLKDLDHLDDVNNLIHEIQSAPISEIPKLKPIQPLGIQDYLDLATGMSMRLRQQVPVGFQWEQDKHEFVRLTPPTPQPAPVAPIPAKPAPKK